MVNVERYKEIFGFKRRFVGAIFVIGLLGITNMDLIITGITGYIVIEMANKLMKFKCKSEWERYLQECKSNPNMDPHSHIGKIPPELTIYG